MPAQPLRMSLGAILTAIVAFLAAPAPLAAQTKPKILQTGIEAPASAIFIGNSFFYYNNGMHNYVARLERAADPEHKQDYSGVLVGIGGSGLDWHFFIHGHIPAISSEDAGDIKSGAEHNIFCTKKKVDLHWIVNSLNGRIRDLSILTSCCLPGWRQESE